MTVTFDLPADVVEMLTLRGVEDGLPLEAVVRWLLLRGMHAAGDYTDAAAAFERDYPYSGLSDDESVSFIQNVREEIWQEQQTPRPVVVSRDGE